MLRENSRLVKPSGGYVNPPAYGKTVILWRPLSKITDPGDPASRTERSSTDAKKIKADENRKHCERMPRGELVKPQDPPDLLAQDHGHEAAIAILAQCARRHTRRQVAALRPSQGGPGGPHVDTLAHMLSGGLATLLLLGRCDEQAASRPEENPSPAPIGSLHDLERSSLKHTRGSKPALPAASGAAPGAVARGRAHADRSALKMTVR